MTNFVIKNSIFFNVPKSIIKFILFLINKIKLMLPLNISRVNKIYFFDLLNSHLIHVGPIIFFKNKTNVFFLLYTIFLYQIKNSYFKV